MHNNIVFWLSAQAKMIISPVVVWLHAGSGGKKFELHLTFGRTKSSVQEVTEQDCSLVFDQNKLGLCRIIAKSDLGTIK